MKIVEEGYRRDNCHARVVAIALSRDAALDKFTELIEAETENIIRLGRVRHFYYVVTDDEGVVVKDIANNQSAFGAVTPPRK